MTSDPQVRFYNWYIQPLNVLRKIPNGDGGFIALATSCFLYERYATAVVMETHGKASTDDKIQQLAIDFQIDLETAEAFWRMIRDGLLHQGMPIIDKQKNGILPSWGFHNDFERPIQRGKLNGVDALLIQPWLFTQRVIQLWQENLTLIDKARCFPWADVTDFTIEHDDSSNI
jgi:hypothetical protein